MIQTKATIVTTNVAENKYWEESSANVSKMDDCMHVVNIFPDLVEQEVEGFGGAFTEAAAHTYASLNEEAKRTVIEGYFGKNGLRYNLGRIPIHSCDFGLGNYTYIEEGDKELKTFDVSRDEAEVLPLIREAMKEAPEGMQFLISPWSPPAFMKDNKEMNHGGKLLDEYKESWANYYVKFIQAYREKGIDICYLTVQNEPMAVQTWDSCVYLPDEEGSFAVDYLVPALRAAGLSDIEVFVWDHNKEALYQRIKDTFAVDGARECVRGIAIHWYTGDHFDAIRAVKKVFPEQKIFFTEGCVEYSRFADSGEINKAEMYAHDMLGDLKAGCNAFLDWNLLLDEKGGPNHVGNFCAAPMMADGKGGVEKRLSYYYIGHFSRYISRGARQIMTSCYTDRLETLAFLNKDGSKTVVMLNKTEREVEVTLCENQHGMPLKVAPHSIVTVILTK